ncbi:hypothetical protein Pmani_012063 [Petrolisthes manimaculis]|uniref:Uncharacterized protein n=1 Tax=Petrolisthes manimaculis TaxID=1843537 RepID=A0AAE1PYU1_9EUCA|nr:hypothetical protein Pmani_012063 [Petrolisthes manimaculis]
MNRTEEVNMPRKKLRRGRQFGDQSCFTDAAAYHCKRWRKNRDITAPDSFSDWGSFPSPDSSGYSNRKSHQSASQNRWHIQDDRHGHQDAPYTSGSSGRWYMFITPLNSEASNVEGNTEEHLDSPVTKEEPSSGSASNCEEDILALFQHTMVDLRTKCEQEKNPDFRQALLYTWKDHKEECLKYLLQPSAHPDHDKEYKRYCDQQDKNMIEVGNEPFSFDYQQGWKKYWPGRMSKLFLETWEARISKCLSTQSNQSAECKNNPVSEKAEKEEMPVNLVTELKSEAASSILMINLNNSISDKTEKEEILFNFNTDLKSEEQSVIASPVSNVNRNNPVCDKEEIPVTAITELESEADGTVALPIININLNNSISDKAETKDIPANSHSELKNEADIALPDLNVSLKKTVSDNANTVEIEKMPANSDSELKGKADGVVALPDLNVSLNNLIRDKAKTEEMPTSSDSEPKSEADAPLVSKINVTADNSSEVFRHKLRRLYLHKQQQTIRIKTGEKADFYLRHQNGIRSEWIWEARVVKSNELVWKNLSQWWTQTIPPSLEKFTPQGTLVAISRKGQFGLKSECSQEDPEKSESNGEAY